MKHKWESSFSFFILFSVFFFCGEVDLVGTMIELDFFYMSKKERETKQLEMVPLIIFTIRIKKQNKEWQTIYTTHYIIYIKQRDIT